MITLSDRPHYPHIDRSFVKDLLATSCTTVCDNINKSMVVSLSYGKASTRWTIRHLIQSDETPVRVRDKSVPLAPARQLSLESVLARNPAL